VSTLGAPVWLVDASRLRSTLDDLREGLNRTSLAAYSPDVSGDRRRILESVRLLLEGLKRHDLDAGRLISSVVTEYRPQARADQLRQLIVDLRHGWERRLAVKLGPEKVSCLVALLSQDVPDFLGLLGRVDNENANSDILASLLDPRLAPM
jgi:hypothetical protein